MSGNFEDIEINSNKSAVIRERMYLAANHMYKQFAEYQKSNANTAAIMDKMAQNAALLTDYFKQSFKRFGVPSQNIYYEYNKQHHILFVNILWHSITFASNMKDSPRALERVNKQAPSAITGRITAVKGSVPELMSGYTPELEQKLYSMEIASLFVPADTSDRAVMKICRLPGQEFLIPQHEAPGEFLLRMAEMVCCGGNLHYESSRVTFSI